MLRICGLDFSDCIGRGFSISARRVTPDPSAEELQMLRICGFTMVPIHIGTGSLNQPQVIPDLSAKEGCKRFAFADLD